MPTDVPLACTCGTLRGVARDVSPDRGLHLTCYCDDCQIYAHALERADELLDPRGGTTVFQMTPSRVELTEGRERLACLRLTDTGLMRWYADCCNTPVGNTVSNPRVPFVGVVSWFIDPEGDHAAELGPIQARVNGRFATRDPGDAASAELGEIHPRAPLWVIVAWIRMLAGAWIRGEHQPSPFFDPQTRAPRVTPRVLTPEQLRAAKARLSA